ncbi:MAG: hypothetical protein ACOC9Y_01740 [Chloroflexota bacterium]
MNTEGDRSGYEDGDLFDDIRQYLAEQSGEDVYEELSRAYRLAEMFAERELEGRPEYSRMLRGIERLVDDVIGDMIPREQRKPIAELLYLYGLAHYSVLQQLGDDDEEEDIARAARPLIVYDIWFPDQIGIEQSDDGYYLHIGDGRIDVSIFLGVEPNERSVLVDLVDHWEYAAVNARSGPIETDLPPGVPMMAIEMDYSGSELIDAGDHVDILFFDHNGDPIIRIHARDTDLRAIVDELQAIQPNGGL